MKFRHFSINSEISGHYGKLSGLYFDIKFLIFTFIDQNLAKNHTNLAEIVGHCMVYGVAFSSSKDPWSLVAQVATKCQVEWWSGLSRESRGSRPC